MATDPQKTSKVATWPVPQCKREVQQFLGFANYYRRFIRDFAQLARPLHRLTERMVPFVWTNQCQESFDTLRRCLCTAPVLAYPNFGRPFILDTDASDVGIGGFSLSWMKMVVKGWLLTAVASCRRQSAGIVSRVGSCWLWLYS